MRTRLLPIAGAALVASAALPASAQALERFDCGFSLLGTLAPSIQPAPTLGGNGTYAFAGDALVCTYVNTATGQRVSTTARIESTGRYENDVCSIGRLIGHTQTRSVGAPGPGTYLDPADPSVPNVTQADYRIDYYAWEGVVRGGSLVTKDGSSQAGTVNNDAAWRITGVAHLEPTPRTGCVSASVGGFGITSTLTAVRP